jgi:hypothetical protein
MGWVNAKGLGSWATTAPVAKAPMAPVPSATMASKEKTADCDGCVERRASTRDQTSASRLDKSLSISARPSEARCRSSSLSFASLRRVYVWIRADAAVPWSSYWIREGMGKGGNFRCC